jgi:hypothetical protein
MTTLPMSVSSSRSRRCSRRPIWLLALTGAVVSTSSCSASTEAGGAAAPAGTVSPSQSRSVPGPPEPGKYPNAIVVLGHSGTTGFNSDPEFPSSDARANSWATGDNPAVHSIYDRLLAVNPAVAGHNSNFGVDGSDIGALAAQVDQALALNPLPGLFMIQEVDNDMQCDGTDTDNYEQFAQALAAQLARITKAAPRATILLVSSPPGTVQNYGEVVAALPEARANNTGRGPCDMFSPAGEAVPAHWQYQETVIKAIRPSSARSARRSPPAVTTMAPCTR